MSTAILTCTSAQHYSVGEKETGSEQHARQLNYMLCYESDCHATTRQAVSHRQQPNVRL